MQYFLWVLGLGVLGFFIGKFIKHKSLYPFMPFRYDFRKRRGTFLKVLELLEKTKSKLIIETGTSREGLHGAKSNGAATIVFGKWAKQNSAFLHSVDISEKSVAASQQEVDRQKLNSSVKIHLSDSIAFLENFKERVDFLYLDSYDYSDDIDVQTKSQIHHLKEFKAIEDQLHDNSIVLIDDCDLPNGGKGKLVVEYMLKHDWRILINAYQILLVRNKFVA
ncbi:class I SAM-dependent methyltransferase [uncultured Algibacter sp.]|uniref:class I SAM-dependent methyltransferase n=1 Tax=uncultured Algibacter sp. TaxID=298659 RepID=UPI002639D6F9|nr:class I SAM-dependent methyltransferase [uncultured Algibacter sp.]